MKLHQLSFVVFDVESVGLYGEGFAFAAACYSADGTMLAETCVACDHLLARAGHASDRQWICDNVRLPGGTVMVETMAELREAFWKFWTIWKGEEGSTLLAADVAWPVEAAFLLTGILEPHRGDRRSRAPYPLVDISNIMLAAGMDPMASWERLPNELPNHNPMADVRQSARLLFEAIGRIEALSH